MRLQILNWSLVILTSSASCSLPPINIVNVVNILQFVDSKSYWCSTAPWVATPFGYTVHSRKRFHFSIPSTV